MAALWWSIDLMERVEVGGVSEICEEEKSLGAQTTPSCYRIRPSPALICLCLSLDALDVSVNNVCTRLLLAIDARYSSIELKYAVCSR